ncbi:MAG: hypothetical protein K9J06_10830 [Flavobacteriales bacterium]|nr:hypothetical protein [Flavobacteriales bacterium]
MESEERTYGVVVVGAGLAGVHACQTLVEAGANVLLLDAGVKDKEGRASFPDLDFETLRHSMADQRRLFLGDAFEGIPWGNLKVGAQLTPARLYLTEGVDRWLRSVSDSFMPMESLAYGGLGNAWGAGCYMFSEAEFSRMGFQRADFLAAYQTVADRIGIAAAMDDASPYTVSGIQGLQPPLEIEPRMQRFLQRYTDSKKKWNSRGIHMGRPALAILTRHRDGREAFAYEDMDFWHDNRRSVYRPWMTMDALKERPGVCKVFGRIVVSFQESDDVVMVHTRRLDNGENEVFKARRLVLCPGVLGTARIVMRSLPQIGELPILCNPYTYLPMLDWRSLGEAMPKRRSGMGQLSVFHDPDGLNTNVSMASLYTYRSLLLFRLVKETPLNFSDARAVMQYLLSGISIAGIHHSESGGHGRRLWLEADANSPTGDVLHADYRVGADEMREAERKEDAFIRFFRAMGQVPLRKVNPGMGASIHYAGVLPMSTSEGLCHTSPEGRLYGTRNVWVGDASSFRYLPAKGISFTLMANAHRVASNMFGS